MKHSSSNSCVLLLLSLLLLFNASFSFGQIPSDLMRNCDQWKITYPTGIEDKTLCGEENNEFFFVNNEKDGITFFVPIRSDNGSTPNSSYIRSELRERTPDGKSDIYWTTTGKHVLYVKQAITHLPTVKPHLVATQIHGNKAEGIDDAMVLRLENQHLFLSFNGEQLRSDVTIKTNYTLGTKHEVIFEVIDGKHYCYYSEDDNLLAAYTNGTASAYLVKDNGNPVLMDLNYGESYFKVGNYTQSNPDKEGNETDEPDNYGEVVVYDFTVEHGESGPINVTGVTLSPSSKTITIGTTSQLTSTISPSDASNKNITYTSSDPDVVTVNSDGLVTAKGEGTAFITVTTEDGDFEDYSEFTIIPVADNLHNIVLNKPINTTVPTEIDNPAHQLVDGAMETRSSSEGYPQVFTIDLGSNYLTHHAELVFYQDRAYQYSIAVSEEENGPFIEYVDRSTNTTPSSGNTPVTDHFVARGRFIQLTINGAHDYAGDWVSILEFRVFGTLDPFMNTKNEASTNPSISVYPNPSRDILNYSLNELTSHKRMDIYSISGKLVKHIVLTQSKGMITISDLNPGLYYIKINGGSNVMNFIKE